MSRTYILRVDNPSVKNQRFLPPPFTQGRHAATRLKKRSNPCGLLLFGYAQACLASPDKGSRGGLLPPPANPPLQFPPSCDMMRVRHNLIGQTTEKVFLFLVKTLALFWLSLVVCQSCVAAIGAVRFSVRGFGCALFYFGSVW